ACVLTTSTCLLSTVKSVEPIATGGPAYIVAGKDALLTCVVSANRLNNTVIWKKGDEILTAGSVRVTSDPRVSVLHDEGEFSKVESGGEVWVLLIKRLKPSDKGSYICELNSDPVSTLDFNLFKCLHFMSEFSSCLFQGYGVLADPPTKLRTVAKKYTFLILDWNKPKRLADTITTFHVKFRRLGVGDDYSTVVKKNPPLILDGLEPEVYYEFYVVSINAYGKIEPSPRLITRTKPVEVEDAEEPNYDMSKCCHGSGLLPQCVPLCTLAQMSKCSAGGRDHTPCCVRRGVPSTCMSLCRGVLPVAHTSSLATTGRVNSNATTDCLSYAGNIQQCLEEDVEGNNNSTEVATTTADASNINGKATNDASNGNAIEFDIADEAAAAANDDIDFIVQY
ncbi:Ig-like and fibronectin type-III domain-containing protein 2, partial [Musca vetustissima]|uniref:Ig-like and fibronectin type-III domain-containing protein 2 n=1 Tax=Musca vetustissima TaxID=27455 RepID=UPI002AB6606C